MFLCSSYSLRSVCVSRSRFWCFFALLTVSEASVSLGVGSGVSLRFWSDSGRDRHLKNAVILTPDSIFILCVD